MAKRPRKNRLERWEVAMVKALLATKGYNDQDVLAYFTRPNRSINHRVVAEIRKGKKHKNLNPTSDAELANFLENWPLIDHKTGLHLLGDELLIKAREAMVCAVQSYNNPGTYFKSEVFIVTAIIAWTYLMHAFYKSKGIDYRRRQKRDGKSVVAKTKQGAEKYWELSQCLKHQACPLDGGTVRNLEFLIGLRHEIEHRMTQRIDQHVSAKLQACCLNFDRAIRQLFGEQFSMDRDLSMALQFASIEGEQRRMLLREEDLPGHIKAMQDAFQERLTEEQFNDPHYAYRVVYVPKTANRKGSADKVVEFVKEGSEEAEAVNRVLLKETEKQKYKPTHIVRMMWEEGFPNFTIKNHADLWKQLEAKDPKKNFGVTLSDRQWYWYENWVDRVRVHCQENQDAYV